LTEASGWIAAQLAPRLAYSCSSWPNIAEQVPKGLGADGLPGYPDYGDLVVRSATGRIPADKTVENPRAAEADAFCFESPIGSLHEDAAKKNQSWG
jgi:hypothetical protein